MLRARIEEAKVYMEAVAEYQAQDVEEAVRMFLTGRVPGFSGAFRPPAPQVGGVTRRAMDDRLDREYRDRLSTPALPPPDVHKDDASRARVAAMVAGLVKNMSQSSLTPDAAAAHRAKEREEAMRERFTPGPVSPELEKLLGYTAQGDAQ